MMKQMSLLAGATALIFVLGCPGYPGGDEGEGEGEEGEGEGEGEGEEGEGEEGEGEEGEGEEGEGEGEDFAFCQAGCSADADCFAGQACDEELGICGTPLCESNEQCTATANGWGFSACTADAECFGGPCVDLDGGGDGSAGGCALAPDAEGNCAFGAPLVAAGIDGGDVDVCGTEQVCNDGSGECEATEEPPPFCAADEDCAAFPAGLQRCVDGQCGCADDDDCAASDTGTQCTDFGFCGCADDGECADSLSGQTCIVEFGFCGCAEDTECADDEICAGFAENPDVD